MARGKPAAVAHSPLEGMAATSYMREIKGRAKIILRGKCDDEKFMAAVKNALGLLLPIMVNKTTRNKNYSVLCTGPDEWMVWADNDERVLSLLQDAVKDTFAALVDVSDYYIIIRINGDNAKRILSAGCPLDLQKNDECAQSRYANAAILLCRVGNNFDVQVRWSFAAYLWRYFTSRRFYERSGMDRRTIGYDRLV